MQLDEDAPEGRRFQGVLVLGCVWLRPCGWAVVSGHQSCRCRAGWVKMKITHLDAGCLACDTGPGV